jgi:hypothetical protein
LWFEALSEISKRVVAAPKSKDVPPQKSEQKNAGGLGCKRESGYLTIEPDPTVDWQGRSPSAHKARKIKKTSRCAPHR